MAKQILRMGTSLRLFGVPVWAWAIAAVFAAFAAPRHGMAPTLIYCALFAFVVRKHYSHRPSHNARDAAIAGLVLGGQDQAAQAAVDDEMAPIFDHDPDAFDAQRRLDRDIAVTHGDGWSSELSPFLGDK